MANHVPYHPPQYSPSRKSPLLAGLLSLLPGLGQIYNEQVGKGLFILFLLFGSAFFMVAQVAGVHFVGIPFMYSVYGSPMIFARLYMLVWLFLFLPILYIFAFSDAVITAMNINRGNESRRPPVPPPGPSPEPQEHASAAVSSSPYVSNIISNVKNEQDFLRTEASKKMDQASSYNESNNFTQPGGESFSGGQEESPELKIEIEVNGENGSRARAVVGLMLIIIGLVVFVDDWDWFRFLFETLWPLAPLYLGVRLIKEYREERNKSQLVFGSGFAAVGVIFLCENWLGMDVLDFLADFWPLTLIAIGAALVFQEFWERRCARLRK